jgi:hypothetical protein
MKSRIKIQITVYYPDCINIYKKVNINLSQLLYGKWVVKVGRSKSQKLPIATITEIFTLAREMIVGMIKVSDKAKK